MKWYARAMVLCATAILVVNTVLRGLFLYRHKMQFRIPSRQKPLRVTRHAGQAVRVIAAALIGGALPGPALAFYDSAKNYVEAPAVAARFPDPPAPMADPSR